MAAKLTLKADPTFVAPVAISVAGGDAVEVKVTFKHRTRAALKEFEEWRVGKTDAEVVMDIVIGWDLADEFNRANVDELLENRMSAGLEMYLVYTRELSGARTKN